jgi:ABC-type dipeptide/oligopeptide/nickel transport system permease component
LSTVQIGPLIGILTGIYSGDKITTDVETFIMGFTILMPYAHSIAVGIVVVILTFSLVLGGCYLNWFESSEAMAKAFTDADENSVCCNSTIYLAIDQFYSFIRYSKRLDLPLMVKLQEEVVIPRGGTGERFRKLNKT